MGVVSEQMELDEPAWLALKADAYEMRASFWRERGDLQRAANWQELATKARAAILKSTETGHAE